MSRLNVKTSPSKKSEAEHGFLFRICGFILILLVIFPVLSLWSYDSRDFDQYSSGGHVVANLIGLAGAYGARYFGFIPFGLCAWLIPLWMALAGFFMMAGKFSRPWRRIIWAFVFQTSLCALFDLSSISSSASLNLVTPPQAPAVSSGAGGALGWFVSWLFIEVCKLGTVGTVLIVVLMLVLSLGFGVGWRNWLDFFAWAGGVIREFRMRNASKKERMEIEERKLARQIETERRQAEKEEERLRREAERDAARKEREAAKEARRLEKEEKARQEEADRLAREQAFQEQKERVRKETEERKRKEEEDRRRAAEEAERRRAAAAKAARADEDDEEEPDSDDGYDAESASGGESEFREYVLPSVDLLSPVRQCTADYGNIEENETILVNTLREFNVDVSVENTEKGPVVTTFELLPGPGIRPEKIAGMAKTLEMRLMATSIRIEAPIPGKCLVGVEIPNKKASPVTVREILESSTWAEAEKKMALPLLLGKDSSGHDLVGDLATMPHLLVAGATGSGKSVCMNAMLTGLLMSRTPEQLRLILVDPKVVEFTGYNAIPHLVVPIITEAKKVSLGLVWAIHEMEKRYKMLSAAGVKNIASFNSRKTAVQEDLFERAGEAVPQQPRKAAPSLPATLPYIVIVIDELADLMSQVGREIEDSISRLAAKARAVGIHLILATQRPTVDVVTGTIKANIPGRIAFQVSAKVDSKTILDRIGAESLIGHGDMLFLNPRASKIVRAQGAYIPDEDAEAVCDAIRAQGGPRYNMEVQNRLDSASDDEGERGGGRRGGASSSRAPAPSFSDPFADPPDDRGGAQGPPEDELYEQALEIVRRTKRASTSSLQRAMRIGYTRAARLIDIMEERGIVGPGRGANPREILVDLDGEIPENSDTPDSSPVEADDGEEPESDVGF